MANVINSKMPNSPVIPRPICSFLEVLRNHYPSITAIARGKSYEDIEWENPADASTLPKALMEGKRIQCTMENWIHILFTEANSLQQYAATYFTFSNRGTVLTQVSMYEQKHSKAKQYIYEISTYPGTLEEAKAAVVVPVMLENEAIVSGDEPYDLAQAVIQNYLESNEAMTAYYGQIEGERRLVKRRILACTSIAELEAMEWANWPEFVPPSADIGD